METNFTSFVSPSSLIAVTELLRQKEELIADNSADTSSSSSSKDPLPYDPLLGWYTAATLSGLLILFLACVGLEKIKDRILMSFDRQAVAPSLRGGGGGGAGEPCLGPGATDSAGTLAPDDADDDDDDAKGASRGTEVPAPEGDALLRSGRNCCSVVDHNYVYLTLDRTNRAEAAPQPQRGLGGAGGDSAGDVGWSEGRGGGGGGGGQDETRTTTGSTSLLGGAGAAASVAAAATHSVKIEIVEVHSETTVADDDDDDVELRRKDSVVSSSAAK